MSDEQTQSDEQAVDELGRPMDGPRSRAEAATKYLADKPKPFMTFADPKRAAINAHARGVRAAEDDEFRAGDPEGAKFLESVAGAAHSEPDGPAPMAFKIVSYGREETLTAEQLVAEATQARESSARLDAREAQLQQWAGQLQAHAAQQSQQPREVDKAKLREAQAALLRGDDELSTELMAEALASAVSQPAAPPAAPASAPDPWSSATKERINEIFRTTVDDGTLSDAAFADAQVLMRARLANPAYLGKSPEALVAEVGTAVRRLYGQTQAPAPRTLKAQIPITPPPAFSRGASAPPQQKFPSASDYVRQLQERSGSNTANTGHRAGGRSGRARSLARGGDV